VIVNLCACQAAFSRRRSSNPSDVPSASAILDRFLHHAEIVAFQGRSYRLKNRLTDDFVPGTGPVATSKPASAPTGNRRTKAAEAAVDTTNQTTTT